MNTVRKREGVRVTGSQKKRNQKVDESNRTKF
jgi:hypothetical protein